MCVCSQGGSWCSCHSTYYWLVKTISERLWWKGRASPGWHTEICASDSSCHIISTLFVDPNQTPPVYISCIICYIFFLCLSPVLYSPPTSVCLFCIFLFCSLLIFCILCLFFLFFYRFRSCSCKHTRDIICCSLYSFFRSNNVALTFSSCLQETAAILLWNNPQSSENKADLCFCAESTPYLQRSIRIGASPML